MQKPSMIQKLNVCNYITIASLFVVILYNIQIIVFLRSSVPYILFIISMPIALLSSIIAYKHSRKKAQQQTNSASIGLMIAAFIIAGPLLFGYAGIFLLSLSM